MPHTPLEDRDRLYSRFNRILAIAIWVVGGLLIVGAVAGGATSRVFYLVPAAFIALLAWEALWQPYVLVDDDGVVLRNVLRTVRVPWDALVHVDTKYALTLFTPGHRYAAWAAPAPGRGASARAAKAQGAPRARLPMVGQPMADLEAGSAGVLGSEGSRPGDLVGTESGDAAYLVRTHWTAAREQGRITIGAAETTKVAILWHLGVAITLIVLFLGSIPAILLA
jgi:hypothetical protein